ncbi:MAG TPA: CPBP family intramembrane glutamic endopeptidase [Nocardioidaceae bacterium]|nr:CPBP family intramembrane glutamic endopeptidase [Nocardioidaceae bacterium]
MTSLPSTSPSTAPAPAPVSDVTPPDPRRQLLVFAVVAVLVGGFLLGLSTLLHPGAPFLLGALVLGLVLPALVLTHRESGGPGVRALLKDCVRLPRSWWWLPLAGFALPVLSWTTGAAIGGAEPLTWGAVSFYVLDLLTGALIINIWEEMAWTGFFQRRAAAAWGAVAGSLVTSVAFTAIHLPLAFDGAGSAEEVATNTLFIAGVATGVRLLVARLDVWSGRSLLTIGLLHSSFNATETLLVPSYDWVRIVTTIAVGVAVVAFGRRVRPTT